MSNIIRNVQCHPERSEGFDWPQTEILRCAQDDRLGWVMFVVKMHTGYRYHLPTSIHAGLTEQG